MRTRSRLRPAVVVVLVLGVLAAAASPVAAEPDPPGSGAAAGEARPTVPGPDGGVEVSALVERPDGTTEVRTRSAPPGAAADALAARWRSEKGVLAAEVSVPVQAFETTWSSDPRHDDQWGLAAARVTHTWGARDAAGQVVAVIDSGVDRSHADLSAALLPGWDFVDGDAVPDDSNGHGTHVTGTSSAVGGNGLGGAGAGLRSRILPVRVLNADGGGSSSAVAKGVAWAVRNGATVINLSLGGPYSAVLATEVQLALDKGIPVVAAMGNQAETTNDVNYPAAQPGVIAVGAVDRRLLRAPFSNTGQHLSLVAPGVSVLSTAKGGGYASMSGTSMATPHVAGAVAVLRAARPTATPGEIRSLLMGSARDLGPAGFDAEYGAGLLDLQAATATATSAATSAGTPSRYVPVPPVRLLDTREGYDPASSPKGTVDQGATVAVRVSGAATAVGRVPEGATAAVLNVTAVGATTKTHVTAYPSGTTPPLASSLNVAPGTDVPNLVTVKLGADGAAVLANHRGSVDLLADLAGYYVPGTDATVGAGYQPTTPTRLVDTRPKYDPQDTPKLRIPAGGTLDVRVAGQAGVPLDASAVALNVTGVKPTARTHVTVYPAGGSAGGASTLNLVPDSVSANMALVPVGEAGSVTLRNNAGDIDLVVDVFGYYGPRVVGHFVAVDPVRLLDSRPRVGALTARSSFDLGLTGANGVPPNATAAVLNLTGVLPTGGTHLTSYGSGSAVPDVSNLNVQTGGIRANGALVSAGTAGQVRVLNNSGAMHVVVDLSGYFVR